MDAEDHVGATDGQDMEVCGEGMALYLDRGTNTQLMGVNHISVSEKNPKWWCGLRGEVQVADEAGLHKIVCAATINQNDDELIGNTAQQA